MIMVGAIRSMTPGIGNFRIRSLKLSRSFVLRLLLSSALIAFVSTKIDFGMVAELLGSIKITFLLLGLFLIFIERVLFAFKWNLLLATKGLSIPLRKILKIYYMSNFIGTFLPSSIGVEVVRAYSLSKHNGDLSESISSVLVDKVLATLALLILPLVGIVLYSNRLGAQAILPTLFVLMAGLAVLLLLVLNRQLVNSILGRLSAISPAIFNRLQKLYEAFSGYMAYKRALLTVFALSFLIQVVRVMVVYVLTLALDQHISLVVIFTFVPLITVLTMLPFAVGGIGIREASYVYFFSQAGLPTTEAFALSIVVYVAGMISIMPGGIFYAMGGLTDKTSDVDASRSLAHEPD